MTAVLRIDDGPATGRENNAFHGRKIVYGFRFALTESIFAFLLENKRDIDACPRLDLVIAVDE